MNQTLEGISGVVQATRTALSVVVAFGVSSIAFSAAIFIFAEIPDIAKYIVGGLPWVLVVTIWFQFWIKAKDTPLPASEDYYIRELELGYRYMKQRYDQESDSEEFDQRSINSDTLLQQADALSEERSL